RAPSRHEVPQCPPGSWPTQLQSPRCSSGQRLGGFGHQISTHVRKPSDCPPEGGTTSTGFPARSPQSTTRTELWSHRAFGPLAPVIILCLSSRDRRITFRSDSGWSDQVDGKRPLLTSVGPERDRSSLTPQWLPVRGHLSTEWAGTGPIVTTGSISFTLKRDSKGIWP